MGYIVLCSLLALCLPSPAGTAASAETGAPDAPPHQAVALPDPAPHLTEPHLDPGVEIEVEVIGTHEWPAKVDTVTTEQIAQMVNAPYVSDVLERIPGADTLTGCPAGAPLITIRGNNSEWTQVLLEGIPISPIGRPYVLNFVPMSAVDTVRILKGPTPPRYPGTTIAGLVLLEMKTGDRCPGLELSGTIGDYGQRLFSANLGGGDSSRNYFLSFSHSETDGWLPHSDMDLSHAAAKIVLAPDARSKLSLVGAHLFGEKSGPRAEGPNPADKWAAEWTDISQPKASLTYERSLSENSDLLVRIAPYWFSGTQKWSQWFTDHDEERFMPWEYELLKTEFHHDIRTAPDRVWTWGGSWQKDVYGFAGPLPMRFWSAIPDDRWREYEKRARSLYAQRSSPTSSGGTLTLGGRYDDEDPGGAVVSPFFSWHEHLNRDTRARLALTRNRRFPKLMELYGQGMWVGNAGLEPELGWTYQADVSWMPGRSMLEISLFRSDLDNLIVANEENVFNNLGDARIQGAELSWQDTWQVGSCHVNYTYLDAWDTRNDRPLVVAFRTAYPRHSAKAGVVLKDSAGGEHAVEVLAYGPRRTDVDAPTYVGDPWNVTVPPRIAGFTSLNYKYTRQLHEHTKLSLAVENILGTEAEDLLFYPRPGRWCSCTLSWQFH
jgi:outer membrane cobalamin receptor